MTDGDLNEISRAIGSLEAGLRAHEDMTNERHRDNQVMMGKIQTDIESLKSWKWKLSGIGAGAGTVAAAVFPYLKKLVGGGS